MADVNSVKGLAPSGYRYLDLTARDIAACCKNFKDLKPAANEFAFPPNFVQREKLLSIIGTIPVPIRGVSYNIPVSFYLRKEHPYYPPYCLVTPTAGMAISPSRYMDAKGMIYLPYLNEWKQDKSNLSDLVQILIVTFGEQCPVYSKPQGQAQPRPPQQWSQTPPPVAYPQQPHPQPTYPGGYPRQPPPPGGAYPSQATPYPTGPVTMPMPGTGGTPYQPPGGPYPTPAPAPYPANPYPGGTVGTVAAATLTKAPSVDMEQAKRASLTLEVEKKVKRQLVEVMARAQEEMDNLVDTKERLQQRNTQLKEMMSKMESKRAEADQAIEELQTKNAELESVLEQLRLQPEEFDIDSCIQGTNVVFNQILNLYAEDNAIDDAMYFLGEALRREAIALDVFLKNTRELSRRQFLVKATMDKARAAAGLSAKK